MNNSFVNVSSNWTQIGGCELSQVIQFCNADPDLCIKPNLDDIINEEKSILLSKGESSEYCEFDIQLHPHYKIQAVSLVCNVAKIEIFQGHLREYLETNYGIIIDESDDKFKSYRYDLDIEKSGVTDLTIKFLTAFNEVCVFGVILYKAPNPNGITSLLPKTNSINTKNVEYMLKNSTELQGPVFKCRQLLELMKSSMLPANDAANSSLSLDQLSKQNDIEHHVCNDSENADITINQLKLYIDHRFQRMEQRIYKYLEKMEERQMKKLDSILRILDKT